MRKRPRVSLGLVALWFVAGPLTGRVVARTQTIQSPAKTVQMQPLPDLRIRNFEFFGEPTPTTIVEGGKKVQAFKQRFRVVVENAGHAPASPHRAGVFYEISGKPLYPVLIESGGQRRYFALGRMDPLHSQTLNGYLVFTEEFAGTQGVVFASADIADEEFMPAYGRVRESNENNNGSARLGINLPALYRQASGASLRPQPPLSFHVTEGLLDILGSTIRGEIHLNNDNGHSDDDHFTGNNPFRSNDSFVRVNDYFETFTVPEIWFERGGMDYHYYVRDLDAQFGGGAGFRGRDLLGIRNGALVLTIRLETGGRVELRGWEYTAGIFYDLSAPDIDITRLDIFAYLTPVLRADGVFTYSDVRVSTDLQVSFIGAYDTVFMNDIRTQIRTRMTREINNMIQGVLSRGEIRRSFEERAMEAFHGFVPFTKLTRMTVEETRISFEYR